MKYLYLVSFALVTCYAQAQKFTISGSVKDRNSGENLIGASIYDLRSRQGTTANLYGFYSLTLAQDSVHLRVSYVGYAASTFKLLLKSDTTIRVELVSGSDLKEVVITGTAEDQIQETSAMSTMDVPVDQIKAMPAFLGETDVLKVLQLLPGVQSGAEGTSGLYVRGGGPDQNLILLDGVPVYNASHLFGFFSVFNADAVNRVELIKGGFPARYGGRLSSVVDISMKEGNSKKLKGEGAIGLVASRLTLEGPIKKDQTSFIISARRTYIDLLAKPLIRELARGETSGYYFYDLNTKINHRLNERNRIYLSLYSGNDKAYAKTEDFYVSDNQRVDYRDESGLQWGNITAALRYNHIISNQLFSNVTATYSRYRFNIFDKHTQKITDPDFVETEFTSNEYISGIRDYAVKLDFDYIPNPSHYVKFGAHAIHHLFSPGVKSYRSTEERDTTFGSTRVFAREFSAYAEDDFLITPRLKINAGVHASLFYVNNKLYHSVQPRISGRYLINSNLSLKASYAQMTQYIHLLTNAGLGLPTDLWVPATDIIKPEQSYISATGLAYNLKNAFEFTLEGYYKKMAGLIEYKDGASFLETDKDWQNKVEVGDGTSYGAEFFAHKKTGRINGWVGYTLSWTDRIFPNLNDGKKFPYKYDRRHDFEIALAYQLKENREIAVTWVYGTGAAISLPKSSYMQGYDSGPSEQSINYYESRNNYRMRAYNRLDISYTKTKKTKWGESSWSFGAYNLYSRKNPFYMDLGVDRKGHKKFVQYSLFPIIPSITYRFKF